MASSTPAGVRRLYTQTGVAGNTLAILDGDNVTERRIEVRRQATPPVGATGFHGDPAFDYTARQFWVKDDVGSSTWTLIGPADSVRVFNSAAITLTTTTVTALTFDSERWDTNTMHSTSSNTDRLTAKVAGKYLVQGYAGFSANAAGERQLRIDKNNTSIEAAEQRSAVGAGATEYMVVSALVDMAVNDYVQLKAYQTSGGNLNVVAQAEVSPQFSMQGPF